jgi:hypothetical protein
MEFAYTNGHLDISLHAITGSNHPKTMRIIRRIGNQRVVILIDSGNTHNFLDSSIVQYSHLGCKWKYRISNSSQKFL